MVKTAFSHVTQWVFDLDNTLYPPEARLFDQMEVRMTRYVMDVAGVDWAEADRLRGQYWQAHGTTLAGLMADHDIDTGHYLTHVHDITLDHLVHDMALEAGIAALPGRRIVFTNGTAAYAARVLDARGIRPLFHAIYGIEEAGLVPKPDLRAYERIFALDGIDPEKAAMFEDSPRNLIAPHELGMQTVHVAPEPVFADYIHHHTNDLAAFLRALH
ncbi:pyrimidine 5'-nucleotidase [Chachezhania sediminis]|uniref:pyrimidine 5'-nucleotidase n=1 Tax=Chachezhania sediminis TaxID=2599291 RepID=UPI00131A77BF|nr:pyrimidine 5'-nucleotidase [Chachezhania sediminis]